mgnify:FL=1
MLEKKYIGEYVSIPYKDLEGNNLTIMGKLEGIVIGDDGCFKFSFNPIVDINGKGKYDFIRDKRTLLRSVPIESCGGINPESRKNFKIYCDDVNKAIEEQIKNQNDEEGKEQTQKSLANEHQKHIYQKMSEERKNSYRVTKIGFEIPGLE